MLRGNYDCCQVQASFLELGEDNSIFEPKKLRKIQIHSYGQTKKNVIGDFKHAGLYFWANSAPIFIKLLSSTFIGF